MIFRLDYINAIKPFIDVPLVKIFAGVRRSGKSTILEMVKLELKSRGVADDSIISRKYTEMDIDDGFTAKDMYADLKNAVGDKAKCYLFLDELQEVDGWEKVVNSLLESGNTDIYVTGSNSKLMASEIETYLSGRYVTIPVYTLSFKEYLQFKGIDEAGRKPAFEQYLQYGGFPIIASNNFDMHSAYQIVDGIYSSVITRDITRRHNIRNRELFDRVVRFVIENVGKTFSANSIVNFLKNQKRSLSVETIYNYLGWLSEAFIVYPCRRYDLQGKEILKTQEKYYLADISFKYSKLGFNTKTISAMLENIVFLEMLRRGYIVHIGKNGVKEIDFIAEKQGDRIYVQVCRELPENSSRETENLMDIKDHYHKYVVSMDNLASGNDNGIQIVHIADFLLRDNW